MALGNSNASAQSRGKNKAVVVKRRKEVVLAKDFHAISGSLITGGAPCLLHPNVVTQSYFHSDKISDMHLKEMQEIVNITNNIQFNIGKIEGQKHGLLHELGLSQKKILNLQEALTKEYGSFDINIADGTINYPKDEK